MSTPQIRLETKTLKETETVQENVAAEGEKKALLELSRSIAEARADVMLVHVLNKYIENRWVNQFGYINEFDKTCLILEQRNFVDLGNDFAPIVLEKPGYTIEELLAICKALEANKQIESIVFLHADLIKLFDNKEAKENMERLALAFQKTNIKNIGVQDICFDKDCVPSFFYNYNLRFAIQRAERNDPKRTEEYVSQLLTADVFIGNKYPKKLSFYFDQLLCKELLKEGRMAAFIKWMVSANIAFFGCYQESKFYFKDRNDEVYDIRNNPFSKQAFHETEKAFITSFFEHLSVSRRLKEFEFSGWNLELRDYTISCSEVLERVKQNRKDVMLRKSITMSAALAAKYPQYALQVQQGENFNKSPVDDVPTKFLLQLFQNSTLANTFSLIIFEMMGVDNKSLKKDKLEKEGRDERYMETEQVQVENDIPTYRMPYNRFHRSEVPKQRTVWKIKI